jgi:hypothetical protein
MDKFIEAHKDYQRYLKRDELLVENISDFVLRAAKSIGDIPQKAQNRAEQRKLAKEAPKENNPPQAKKDDFLKGTSPREKKEEVKKTEEETKIDKEAKRVAPESTGTEYNPNKKIYLRVDNPSIKKTEKVYGKLLNDAFKRFEKRVGDLKSILIPNRYKDTFEEFKVKQGEGDVIKAKDIKETPPQDQPQKPLAQKSMSEIATGASEKFTESYKFPNFKNAINDILFEAAEAYAEQYLVGAYTLLLKNIGVTKVGVDSPKLFLDAKNIISGSGGEALKYNLLWLPSFTRSGKITSFGHYINTPEGRKAFNEGNFYESCVLISWPGENSVIREMLKKNNVPTYSTRTTAKMHGDFSESAAKNEVDQVEFIVKKKESENLSSFEKSIKEGHPKLGYYKVPFDEKGERSFLYYIRTSLASTHSRGFRTFCLAPTEKMFERNGKVSFIGLKLNDEYVIDTLQPYIDQFKRGGPDQQFDFPTIVSNPFDEEGNILPYKEAWDVFLNNLYAFVRSACLIYGNNGFKIEDFVQQNYRASSVERTIFRRAPTKGTTITAPGQIKEIKHNTVINILGLIKKYFNAQLIYGTQEQMEKRKSTAFEKIKKGVETVGKVATFFGGKGTVAQ